MRPANADEQPEADDAADLDDLAALAAKVVSSWPRLSDARKAELGRLLGAS